MSIIKFFTLLFYKLFIYVTFLVVVGMTVFFVLPVVTVLASQTDGAISGYAWSSEIGWIRFDTTSGNARLAGDDMTGYAWNENVGWINLNPSNSGVSSNNSGALSGRAWSEGTGWIDFAGVTVSSQGRFFGTATGDIASINFSCANCLVTTDWRAPNDRGGGGGSGSGGGGGSTTDTPPTIITPPVSDPVVILIPKPNVITTWPAFLLGPPLAPILRDLAQGIQNIIPKFFRQFAKIPSKPIAVITVPKIAPLAFSGNFRYLSSEKLSLFALAPLPKEVRVLAQKFPKVQDTFDKVGIKKITDLQKLARANLKLPTLSELSLAKNNLPFETVFATAGGGLVDFSVGLSLNNQGQTQQMIKTMVGKPLQLLVRADQPVERVTGYVIFKSRKYVQASSIISLNHLTASLVTATGVDPIAIGSTPVEQRLVVSEFEYQNTGNGVYTATIEAPLVDAEYEIITIMDYQDPALGSKEIRLVTVVDPEGYVYEKHGRQEIRITGAAVSLYWLNPKTKKYDLWPARDFQQENSQITNVRGTYSFLVPPGYYYLRVDAPGYISYEGKPFEVREGSGVHTNIEMKTKYWFLNVIDWKTLLLIAVLLLLGYNFYKDKLREKHEI